MRYRFGSLVLNSEQRVLFDGETRVPLAPKTYEILHLLLENAGEVVNRETLRQRVWDGAHIEEAVVSRNLSLLRIKLRPFFGDTEVVETISKRGYRLLIPVHVSESKPEAGLIQAPVEARKEEPIQEQAGEEVVPDTGIPPAPAVEALQRAPARRAPVSRFGWVALLFAVVLVLLAVTGYRMWRNEHVLAKQRELAVLDFRDLSSSPDASWMGVALEESLSRQLSRDHGATALAGDQVAVGVEDLGLSHARTLQAEELQQLDRRLGVEYILTGTYMPLGDLVRVDLQLHQGDRLVQEFSDTVEQRDLQAAIDRISAQIRATLHLPPARTGGELEFFGQSAKDNLAAHFYAEGLRLSRTGDTPMLAREAFSKAVEADPSFAEAHGALARAWLREGHEAESVAEARLALATDAALPEGRRLALEASAYRITGQYAKALDALTRLRQLYPGDQSYKLLMARTLFQANQYAQATVLLREIEADRTHPPNLPALELLTTVLAQQGDRTARFLYAQKIMTLARAEGSRSAEARAHLFAGMGWMGALDGTKAVAEFQEGEKLSAEIGDKVGVLEALTDETAARMEFHLPGVMAVGQRTIDLATELGREDTVASECINLGSAALYGSQLRLALAYSRHALELGKADPTVRLAATENLALAYLRLGDLPEAEKNAALQMQYAREMKNERDLAPAWEHQAAIDSYLGQWAQAQSNYEKAVQSYRDVGDPPAANDALVNLAWMQMQRGDAAQAAATLRTADLALLVDNGPLAGYVQGRLDLLAGDPGRAETAVNRALAKDPVPSQAAIGLDVLMEIAVQQRDIGKARAVAERYAALARSIPEDGLVRRGAVRAAAEAELLAGDRAGADVQKLPDLLDEATRLHHASEIAATQRVLDESRR